MKLYKLTDAAGWTHGELLWGKGVKHEIRFRVAYPQLCTGDVIHAYAGPELGLLMNPVHASYDPFRLWEAEGVPVVAHPDKLGVFALTTTRELEIPAWYEDKRLRPRVEARFAIAAARAVLSVFGEECNKDDRPRLALEAAEKMFNVPHNSNADAAGKAADGADGAAGHAFTTYGRGTGAYDAAMACSYAAYAAYAAAPHDATYAGHFAKNAALYAGIDLDLAAIARKAAAQEVK